MPEPPVAYVVDVCATCGRLAQWPFCEHRPEQYRVGERPWTIPVRVVLRARDRQILRASMKMRSPT